MSAPILSHGWRRVMSAWTWRRRGCITILLVGLTSWHCSKEPVTRPQGGTLSLAVRFPGEGMPAPARQEAATVIDLIRVSVFNLSEGAVGALLTQADISVSQEQTEFEVTVEVGTAVGYRVEVQAIGQRQRPGRINETTQGVQFVGEADVGSFQLGPVEIQMSDIVPLPTIRREFGEIVVIDRLRWDEIPGATSYTVRDSFSVLAEGLSEPAFQVVDGRGSGYRVSSTLPRGLTSAFSEGVSVGPAPVITRLAPDWAPSGGAAFVLSVVGDNFQPGSIVRWNEDRLPTTFVSSGNVTAAVDAVRIVSPGSAFIDIENPGGQRSDAFELEILGPPTISDIVPDPIPAGLVEGADLTVRGTNLPQGSVVTWNGVDLSTSFQSMDELSCFVPPEFIEAEGTATIQVRTPDGRLSNTRDVSIQGF